MLVRPGIQSVLVPLAPGRIPLGFFPRFMHYVFFSLVNLRVFIKLFIKYIFLVFLGIILFLPGPVVLSL